jgi:hypothetical protein
MMKLHWFALFSCPAQSKAYPDIQNFEPYWKRYAKPNEQCGWENER